MNVKSIMVVAGVSVSIHQAVFVVSVERDMLKLKTTKLASVSRTKSQGRLLMIMN